MVTHRFLVESLAAQFFQGAVELYREELST
jgi:hypothetical protein